MKITYEYYAPNRDYEEIQAAIYADYMRRMPYTVFRAPTKNIIQDRNLQEKKDPKFIRYAFTEGRKPLAYIQVSIGEKSKQIWIGYPWAMEVCPQEVQETLYTEMLAYAQAKYPDYQVVMGYISESWTIPIEFARSKGFTRSDSFDFYHVDLTSVLPFSSTDIQVHIGNEQDIDALVALAMADPLLRKAFSEKSDFIRYFAKDVIPKGNTIMLYRDQTLIAATAPLSYFYKGAMMRFTGLLPGEEENWELLVRALADHLKSQKFTDPLLFFSYENWDFLEPRVNRLGAKKVDTQILFSLKKE